MRSICRLARVLLFLAYLPTFIVCGGATVIGSEQRYPNLDVRKLRTERRSDFDAPQNHALARLRTKLPGLRVEPDDLIASPKFVFSTDGLVSGPDEDGKLVGRHRPIERFLQENRDLFGHGAEVFSTARLIRDYATEQDGI